MKDDPNKSYYLSEWNEKIDFNFHAINLERVYENIIKKFIRQVVSTENMNFAEVVVTDKKITTLSSEIQALKNKIQVEKQFKKKLELNQILQSRSQELRSLQNL
jgi:ABC-type sugar transport system ATPase subunit